MRTFYFKVFHRTTCTNKFLHKIGRRDSQSHYVVLVKKMMRTWSLWLWKKILVCGIPWVALLKVKPGIFLDSQIFRKCFGLDVKESEHKRAINLLNLCLKFYIYRCKFQDVNPSFQAYKNMVKIKFGAEYEIAESKGKLLRNFPLILVFNEMWFFNRQLWVLYFSCFFPCPSLYLFISWWTKLCAVIWESYLCVVLSLVFVLRVFMGAWGMGG